MDEIEFREDDATYDCPSCGEAIVIPLDLTEGNEQQFIEDCPVCCHPNQIYVSFGPEGEAVVSSEST
ncbi:CPXCG motif-containing cysteine-rich protein [Stratiformator vulcanicus]|uniref:CPXCG motif-containing cysteine-rich protein n=1 Tax=Stratiformator vulcanicus TaxID=2527980 RepID=A0A517R4Q9_9PLAN|nr:CPXCG motif-containing cysteine-rich protein [Stratiformator vulcanicus]QDT38865.1 hypothetical protein Pan189_32640 [Stratiformator vulcanicus]